LSGTNSYYVMSKQLLTLILFVGTDVILHNELIALVRRSNEAF